MSIKKLAKSCFVGFERQESDAMKRIQAILMGCLLMLGLCSGCGARAEDAVIARIDEREVMKSEYMVYLYTTTQSFVGTAGSDVWDLDFDGMTADELMQERAFHTIQSVVAAEQYAEENHITLTDEDKKQVHDAAEDFLMQISDDDFAKMGISEKQLDTLMESSYLYTVVYDKLAAECEVNPKEMALYCKEHAEDVRKAHIQVTMNTIMVEDPQTANLVAQKAQAGEDFAALFAQYDTDKTAQNDPNSGEMTLYQQYLYTTFGITEPLTVGQVTDPIEVNGQYFILKIKDIQPPTQQQVQQQAEEEYRQMVQMEYVDTRLSKMMEAQKVEKVLEVWENLDNFHTTIQQP